MIIVSKLISLSLNGRKIVLRINSNVALSFHTRNQMEKIGSFIGAFVVSYIRLYLLLIGSFYAMQGYTT